MSDGAPDMVQASKWEWTVAALGAVLIGLLWAPWYQLEQPDVVFNNSSGASITYTIDQDLSGWATGTVTSIVIGLIAVSCIGQAFILRTERSPAIGLTFNVAINFAAIVAVIWIAARIIWPPADVDTDWGIWASLGAAVAILVAGWLGMRDERDDPALERDVPIRPIPPPATTIADR
jgi:hypothetical protein